MPSLRRSEFLNVLALSVRGRVVTYQEALTAWKPGIAIFGHQELEPDGEDILAVAIRLGISAYDAHFVVLAEQLGCSLVTGDRKLANACEGRCILIEDFSRGTAQ
ncbi:MAG: type II toxin-antitoxin system VapC family toxin [Candidatus Schekmanbacteria bacterium]|nr:type II toxin-antitoxin system VapC family toxin [Candidatus Schekmanbacteria bacterium]